ncbi:phospholipase A2 inhibitor gamma subunit B-like [Hyperolius riggenbachi]|uniref:phospholipase A2 inhibitor gamma subunit B-like n=1 Tax=Hyperolius riggenbachi TaxID=752182 RepID=UPI0035A28BC6
MMLFSFGTLLVVFSLAGSGHSLSCLTCRPNAMDQAQTSCAGTSEVCPSGNVCGATYTQISAGGEVSTSYEIKCMSQPECFLNGSITSLAGSKTKLASACCNTDNCIPTLPPISTDSSKPNGVVCRACVSASSTWCYTSDTVQCTGEEKMCLLQSTTITGAMKLSVALRGCSTKSLCDIGTQSTDVGEISTKVSFTCTSGSPALLHSYLPALMSLLLMKLLF